MLIESKTVKGTFFEVKPFSALPCRPYSFKIKGAAASLDDFGDYVEGDKNECEDLDIVNWGCYKKYFKTKPYADNKRVAKAYNLTENEYNELCKVLEDVFAIGTCGWCV